MTNPSRPHLLLAFLAAHLLGGCATYQTVRIESDPPGAQIYVNGAPVGAAPVSKSLLVVSHFVRIGV